MVQASKPLRLCSWNIDRSGVRGRWREKHQALSIASHQADVAILTEAHDSLTIEGLQSVAFSANGKPPYHPFEHAVGVWSHLPVLELLPVRTPRLATCVVLGSPMGPLVVYGTIIPYRDEGLALGIKRWQAHRDALELQLRDWADIRHSMPRHHLVIAGDFNMTMPPSNNYVDLESRARLLTACERLALKLLTGDDVRSSMGRANIDHILASRELAAVTPTEYWMANENIDGTQRLLSDHNGVTVSLSQSA